MKKLTLILLIFVSILLFIGCEEKETPIDEYKEIANESLKNDIYGLIYEKKQIYNEEEVYKKRVETKVESYENNQGIVKYYEKSLNEFDINNKYKIEEYTKEYNSSTSKLDKLQISIDLNKILVNENIIEYLLDNNTLIVKIKDEAAKSMFENNISEFTLTLIDENKKLSSILIEYKVNSSIFNIEYLIKY